MKYLAEPKLDQLSTLLSTAASSPSGAAEAKVTVKFELYSVKQLREDRRMVKEREEMYMSEQEGMDEMSFSPEMKEAGLSSCFGRLDEKESRKVHYLLVQCLNSAFPEHDFAALQPEHFTREPNAGVVLEQLSGRLLYKTTAFPQLSTSHSSPLLRPVGSAPGSSPFSSSPSHAHAPLGPAGDLYKSLCDVVPLDECDVYSWLPSPEYDPHVEPEEGELGDDWYDYAYGDVGDGAMDDMDVDMDMDLDEPSQPRHGSKDQGGEGEAMWGNAGMEIEEEVIPLHGGGVEVARVDSKGKRRTSDMPPPALPPSGAAMAKRASVDDEMMGLERTGGGLLWSANYFFYSKRNKRILFVTTWSRRRTAARSYAMAPMESAFPETISSSSLSTSASAQQPPSPLAPRRYKTRTKSRHKPHARPSIGNGSGSGSGGHGSSMASGSGTNKQRGFPGPSSVGRSNHGLGMGTIPIRTVATPPRTSGLLPQTPSNSGRLASSAPNSSFGSSAGMTMTSPIVTPGAMSRMTAGGFKPKPHGAHRSAGFSTGGFSPKSQSGQLGPARATGTGTSPTGNTLGITGNRQSGLSAGLASFAASGDAMRQAGSAAESSGSAATGGGVDGTGEMGQGGVDKSRVRKDRSESTTPGPSLMRSGPPTHGAGEAGAGSGEDKRVKV